MLLRHLYRYDEVRAALLWCIVHRRIPEGLFWTQELLDSGCHTELFQVLFEGWLWSVGISRVEWLRRYWILFEKPDLDEEELVQLVYGLLRLPMRDSTTLHLLVRGPCHTLERLPPTPSTDRFLPTITHLANTPLKETLVRYIRLGKAVSAWIVAVQLRKQEGEDAWWTFLSRYELCSDGSPCVRQCFDTLQNICTSLFPNDDSIRIACQATAIGFLCLSPLNQTKSRYVLPELPIDSHSASLLIEWKGLEGRRARRVYMPPSDCLSWMTSRGCNPYTKTTLKELRSLSIDTLREKGCPFWQDALDRTNPWLTDDAFEDFWDTYFPDDIPDEWSLENQKQSHGPGVLRPGEQSSVGKLASKWFLHVPSLLIWTKSLHLKSLYDKAIWNTMKGWTSGYEDVYRTMPMPDLPLAAKAIRFAVCS